MLFIVTTNTLGGWMCENIEKREESQLFSTNTNNIQQKGNYSQLPQYRSPRDLYYMFDKTEFRYKRCYIYILNLYFQPSTYSIILQFSHG